MKIGLHGATNPAREARAAPGPVTVLAANQTGTNTVTRRHKGRPAGRLWNGEEAGPGAVRNLPHHCAAWSVTRLHLIRTRWPRADDDRGDVPGWVLVTLMTAGLVVALWGAAGQRLVQVFFNDSVDNVVGGP